MKLLIKGGRVIDPAAGVDAILDVLIDDSTITKVDKDISSAGARVIDATDKVVAPGFIDMHTHLREPGREDEETIESGSHAGVTGGFTTLVPMANTTPVTDNKGAVDFIVAKARVVSLARIHPVAAVTQGLRGDRLTEMGDLKEAGVVAFSDDGKPISNSQVMRDALEYSKMFDLPIISHCEDPGLTGDGCMNEGVMSVTLGLVGMPAAAEEIMVARDLILAELSGGRLHIAHVSTAGSVELIRTAKARGVRVTAETAPHYFALSEEAVHEYDPNTKMNPPLRTKSDLEEIKQGLKDGTIDSIATDHAPHSLTEKEVEFAEAPFGIVGLETASPLIITRLVDPGVLSLSEALAKITYNPATILDLPQGRLAEKAPADVVIFDPERKVTIKADDFHSKCRNTPFDGWELKGSVEYTIVGGKVVVEQGKLVRGR